MAEALISSSEEGVGNYAEPEYRRVGTPGAEYRDCPNGDPLQSQSLTLTIENMTCGACMRKVEARLNDIPGVRDVRANLSAKRVLLTLSSAAVTAQQLIDVLAEAGFKAAELSEAISSRDKDQERHLLQRVAVAGFAAANIMLLSVSIWSGGGGDMTASVKSLFHWISAVIALPVVVYAGQPFYASALTALRSGRLNMDVPISLGVLLATSMSLYQTTQSSEQVYFDAAVTLLFFLLIGRFLDTRMRARAHGAAANLLSLRATAAKVLLPDGSVETIASRRLQPGMNVLVPAGARIAVDGRLEQGESAVDESLITGESLPRKAVAGDWVYAGSINIGGPIVVKAVDTDDNTLLSEIGRLMSAAEQNRSRYVRLADRAAGIYAPAVHILSLATFCGWMLFGATWQMALTAAIATLIITCPCALALAVPVVQVAATSRLFAKGILVKAADGLERMAEIDTVVFDKTGTLTSGIPQLLDIRYGDETDLQMAASLAVNSNHPYAKALVAAARKRNLSFDVVYQTTEIAGLGLKSEVAGGEIRLGSATWCGAPHELDETDAAIWMSAPGKSPAAFTFSETLRTDAAASIRQLSEVGLDVQVLSGDRVEAVVDVAADLGIQTWRARQTPADKIEYLEALKSEGRSVLMIGDGLNDAPALAAASASLSPATAADISQTAADAIFQGEKLGAVVETLAVAQASRRMALQNFAIALGYNAVFVPLAMLGLVTPLLAAIAMSASSIGVTANALRLRSRKLEVTGP
ncbi:MAG: heavy metal translocating P-type ATPase [Hyphomicrobiaceae bacterium]